MTQQAAKQYTWDDTVAAIGQDFSGGWSGTAVEAVGYNDVRRYCEPLELDCPLYHDEQVAKAHGFRGVVVPYSSLTQTFTYGPIWAPGDSTRWPDPDSNALYLSRTTQAEEQPRPVMPKPATTDVLVTDIEIEYFEPVCVGDRMTTKGNKLIDVKVRATRVGFGAFIRMESEVYNQRGELVAKVRRGTYQYNREDPR